LLKKLREEAEEMMALLVRAHIEAIAYGSLARGDVSQSSDIDIFIPKPPSPTFIQAILEREGVRINHRLIVQATPTYAAKAYLNIEEKKGYSFSLVELNQNEIEFYKFAGRVNLSQVQKGERVTGVNKDLQLIEPTSFGHKQSSIQGREGVVAKKLGVDVRIVLERVRTLERRGKVGRTGVFIKRELADHEEVSTVFRELSRTNPAIRRRLRK
jgi:predicted nucleotidyltransferase